MVYTTRTNRITN